MILATMSRPPEEAFRLNRMLRPMLTVKNVAEYVQLLTVRSWSQNARENFFKKAQKQRKQDAGVNGLDAPNSFPQVKNPMISKHHIQNHGNGGQEAEARSWISTMPSPEMLLTDVMAWEPGKKYTAAAMMATAPVRMRVSTASSLKEPPLFGVDALIKNPFCSESFCRCYDKMLGSKDALRIVPYFVLPHLPLPLPVGAGRVPLAHSTLSNIRIS